MTDPPTGLPTDLHRPSADASDTFTTHSPTPTSASSSTTATESKKKHSFFDNFKLKEAPKDVPVSSPFPPETPTKAAQFFGVPTVHQHDTTSDGPTAASKVGHGMAKSFSMPTLTSNKGASGSKFKEVGIAEPVKSKKSIWGSTRKHHLQKYAPYSPRKSPRPQPGQAYSLAKFPLATREEEDAEFINSIPLTQQPLNPPPRRSPPTPPLPLPPASRQRSRRKDARLVDRMASIKEDAYDEANADAELALIETYSRNYHPTASLPRSNTEPLLKLRDGSHGIEDDDLTPTDQGDGSGIDEQEYETHRGFHFASDSPQEESSTGFRKRSPLQQYEDRLLDAAEMALEARKVSQSPLLYSKSDHKGKGKAKAEYIHDDGSSTKLASMQVGQTNLKNHAPVRGHQAYPAPEDAMIDPIQAELDAYKADLDKSDARRLVLDAEVATMKASHEKMKANFNAMKLSQDSGAHFNIAHDHGLCRNCGGDAVGPEESDGEEDLVSIRSSIDLEEEPTVHVARAVTITRVTPGMVKLVDIPPRKKAQTYTKDWVEAYVASEQGPVEDTPDDDVRRDREVPPAPCPK